MTSRSSRSAAAQHAEMSAKALRVELLNLGDGALGGISRGGYYGVDFGDGVVVRGGT